MAMRIPATFDAIQAGRSTTAARPSPGTSRPVTWRTGSMASAERSRSIATASRACTRERSGPRGASRVAVAIARLHSTVSAIRSAGIREGVGCRGAAGHRLGIAVQVPGACSVGDDRDISAPHLERSNV
ncbi:unannotated protein [freshwater metagenome]|uniref:Unannotated protein n=1 Tax=freshwater metagenome TaxID=449393 RepID=A0A6J6UGQ8_9ZZZZ